MSSGTNKMTWVPEKRGRHSLHVTFNDVHICGSPIPLYVTIRPNQLKCISAKRVLNAAGIKCHNEKIYVCSLLSAVVQLDSTASNVERTTRFSGVGEIVMNEGFIFATDCEKNRVVKMDMEFRILKSVGTEGCGPCKFDMPNGIRMSRDNEIYVCDTHNNRIQVFDTDLNPIRIIGGCSLREPYDLDFDTLGNLYVVDSGNNRIQVLTTNGENLRNIEICSTTVAVHRGLVYATNFYEHCISVFTTAGQFVARFGEDDLSDPEGIAIDSDGYVYVSDERSRITRF